MSARHISTPRIGKVGTKGTKRPRTFRVDPPQDVHADADQNERDDVRQVREDPMLVSIATTPNDHSGPNVVTCGVGTVDEFGRSIAGASRLRAITKMRGWPS